MKKIVLLCCAGMSTSMLVQRMKTEAEKQGKEYDIEADTINKVDKMIQGADIVMLGPQVRFATQNFRKKYPDYVFVDIPMQMYGTFDGRKILAFAEENMKKQ